MSARSSQLFLNDLLEAIGNILQYTDRIDIKKFSADQMVKDAVVRNFEIIGEAAKNLPAEIKTKYPDIPWKEMAGMRDKMIHEYFGVDVDIIWQTVRTLPELKTLIQQIKL